MILQLPHGSQVSTVEVLDTETTLLGQYNIPTFTSTHLLNESIYIPAQGTTTYPTPLYATETYTTDYHDVVKINVALITYNPQTKRPPSTTRSPST